MALTINGTVVASPDTGGIGYAIEKIWSKNAGRVASAKMVGDIKARKFTLSIVWSNLSAAEYKTILIAADTDPFFNVTFLNPRTDAIETKEFYSGAPKAALQDNTTETKRYKGVTLDLIER